jgi:activator of HSP90 ATPase
MKMKVTTIKQNVIISAEPEEVYDAFMDVDKHLAFTGSKSTCNPKIEGKFTAWDNYILEKKLEMEKGKRIAQEWVTSEWPKGYSPSKLELIFNKIKEGTEILMIQSNVPADQVEDLKQGWIDFYWKPLKECFKN